MTECHECRELLGGHVLAALEEREADAVRRHLESCPECAEEHRRLRHIPVLLDLAESPDAVAARPRPELEDSVLDHYARLRAERAGRRGRRLTRLPRGIAHSGALAARLRSAATGTLAAVAALGLALLAVAIVSFNGSHSEIELAGSSLAPDASAVLTLDPSAGGTSIRLRAEGLEPTSGRDVYELWFVNAEGRVSAGTFRVGASGRAEARLGAAVLPDEYPTVGVTHEPDPADPARNGVNVLQGSLER